MKKILNLAILIFVLMAGTAMGQAFRVTGTVTDASDGTTLPGVSVQVQGTTVGTISDFNGRYELEVPNENVTLVFSFVGYETLRVPVNSRNVIDVALETGLVGLQEVVVVGYGTQRRDAVTGSVGIVGSQQIEQVPLASFDQILQGQSAGVSSISSSGRPGAGSTIQIRGRGSISISSQPLYVIDGIPISDVRGLYENPLSGINPNDIESVTILKDASAAAIYGSRGANGVILVTTKRGTAGERSQLTYRGQYGTNMLTQDNFNMMNTEQKLQFERDNNLFNRPDHVWDSLAGINTNWRDEMFRSGQTQSHEISTSGGNERTRYFLSGGFFQQEGLLERSDFERITGRLNLDHFITEQLKVGTSLNLSHEQANYSVAEGGYANNVYNPIFAAYLTNPYEQPRDADGEWITSFDTYFGNVLRELSLNQDYNNTTKFMGNVFAEYEPIDNLMLRSSLGIDFQDYIFEDYLHPDAVWGSDLGGSIRRGFRRSSLTTFSNTARYNRQIANVHSLTGLVGYETTYYDREFFNLRGDNFASDKVRVPGAATDNFTIGGSGTAFSLLSVLSQVNYAYDNRYFADVSFRRDGSSRFGRDVRYANFWSVGFTWNVKREQFLANVDPITNLRLRTSYGTTGNYQIGNYDHLGLYSVGLQYVQNPGSAPIRPANPNLTWETSEGFNFAVETRFFDRFDINVEFYNRITKDMLLLMPVSRTSGFTSERRNVGQMTNRGIELTLNADVVSTQLFTWNLSTNFTYNQNTVDRLYLDVTEYISGSLMIQEGTAYGTFHYNQYAGVNPANGRPLWYDQYGNVTNKFRDDDRVTLEGKNFIAPMFGGINSAMTIGNFQLNAFFSYVLDRWMVNNTKYFVANQSNFAIYNQSADVLDHWKEPGDNVHYPRYGTVPASIFDTRFLEDASFLRLRNLTLAYRVPASVYQAMRLQNMRVYVQGQNLWTLTQYTGFDPESDFASELNIYPAARTITFGVDIGL